MNTGSNNMQMILTILLVLSVFVNGTLWTKVNYLEKGGVGTAIAGNTGGAVGAPVGTGGNAGVGAGAPAADAGQGAKDMPKVTAEDRLRSANSTNTAQALEKAQVALVEYSDFECPFCKRFHPTAEQAMKEYGDKFVWVYRHFPLSQIHPKAQKLAEGSECAFSMGGNDAFWKLADAVYAEEVAPSTEELPALAAKTGLDQAAFKTCLDGGKQASIVDASYQGGIKSGVTGTPGNIVVNLKTGETKVIPGAVPYDQLKQAIDSLLKES